MFVYGHIHYYICAVLGMRFHQSDYIQALKEGRVRDTQKLMDLIQGHAKHHVDAYGKEEVKSKFHAAFHLPKHIEDNDGLVADTFTNERENKKPKGFGDKTTIIKDFEEFVLVRNLSMQLEAWKKIEDFEEFPGLIGSKPSWNASLGAWAASGLQHEGLHVYKDDIVRARDDQQIVIVKACCKKDSHLFLIGDECKVLKRGHASLVVRREVKHRLVWITSYSSVAVAK